VHYISTCGAGYVMRLALADIAGHGESVDGFAIALRKLMRKYINTLDQTRFARAINRELRRRRRVLPLCNRAPADLLRSDKASDGERLVSAIDRRRGSRSEADNQTVVVIKRAQTPLPRASLLQTARMLAKMVGLSRV
jgi:hypothetical protein